MLATGESTVTVSLEPVEVGLDQQVMLDTMRELSRICHVSTFSSCSAISVVGADISTLLPHLLQVSEKCQLYP